MKIGITIHNYISLNIEHIMEKDGQTQTRATKIQASQKEISCGEEKRFRKFYEI